MFDDLDEFFGAPEEEAEEKSESGGPAPDVPVDSEEAEAYMRRVSGQQVADAFTGPRTAGMDPALDLARPALAQGLGASRRLHAVLGEQLEGAALDRQSRRILRRARRVLEDAFGLDAVRQAPAEARSRYARVDVPDLRPLAEGGFVGAPLAVHRFDRKLRKIRGGGTKPYYVPGRTYAGPAAVAEAVRDQVTSLRNRINRLEKDYARLEAGRGGYTVEARKRRIQANLAGARAELAQYETLFQSSEARPSGQEVPELTPAQLAIEGGREMMKKGAGFIEVRNYLIEVGKMSAREARGVAKQIFAGD